MSNLTSTVPATGAWQTIPTTSRDRIGFSPVPGALYDVECPVGTPVAGGCSVPLTVDANGATARVRATQAAVNYTVFDVEDAPGVVSAYGNGTLGAAVMTIAAPDGTDVGDVLTATPSTGWTVGGYQWTRNGVDISAQTSSTYTLVFADTGTLIGCRATSALYTALLSIPAGAFPAGYLSLDGGAIAIDSAVLSLV